MMNIDRLVYFIKERESIRRKKELGVAKPWTNDPILRAYRFCNVRRMDDKVSQWLWNNWYNPFKDHTNMVCAAALARHFNNPDTLSLIQPFVFHNEEPHWGTIKQVVRRAKANGATVFNGAYMVRGIGTSDKTEMVVDKVCKPLHRNLPPIDTSSMKKAVEAFLPYWGFSSFMAGQVVADLRWAMTGTWADKKKWAPIGPGSKRGMNRVMRRDTNSPLHQEQFLKELRELMDMLQNTLSPDITKRLEAMDYQNCLCEIDGYLRVLLDGRRKKQNYPGKS